MRAVAEGDRRESTKYFELYDGDQPTLDSWEPAGRRTNDDEDRMSVNMICIQRGDSIRILFFGWRVLADTADGVVGRSCKT